MLAEQIVKPPKAARVQETRLVTARTLEIAALVAIVVLSGLLRFPGLDDVPPSMTYDEAINGLDVYRIFDGLRAPFFPNNNGRESLYFYLQAASVAVFGAHASSLRHVSALFGVLTIVGTWALLRAWFGRAVALLGAGLLATLFWHVVMSRLGLRVNASPFAMALALWLFWRMLRSGTSWDAVLCGLAVGLSQHTYIAARLLPPLLAALFAMEWWSNRSLLRERWKLLLLATVVALAVFAPLGIYLLRHPEDNVTRWRQVMLGGTDVEYGARYSSPLQSIPRTLLMFNLHGSEDWSHNIAGRPAFDPVSGLLFLAGVVVALWRALRPPARPVERDDRAPHLHAYRWLLAASVLLLVPSAITLASPHFLRSTIGLPAFVAFPAIGAVAIWQALTSRLRAPARLLRALPFAAAGGAIAGILVLALVTQQLYWGQWARSVETWTAFSGLALAPVHAFREHLAAGGDPRSVQVVYDTLLQRLEARLANGDPRADRFSDDERLAPISFLVPQAETARRVHLASSVYLLTGPADADNVHLALSTDHYELAADYFSEASPPEITPGPNGFPAMIRVVVPGDAVRQRLASLHPLDVDFGDVRLAGALASARRLAAGDTVTVDLYWRVVNGGNKNFGPSATLVDAAGIRWAEQDRQGIVLDRWRTGDEFLSRHRLTLPADAPPGPYRIEVAMALRTLFPQPTTIISSLGAPATVASVEARGVRAGSAEPQPVGQPDGRLISPGVVLAAVAGMPASAKPGDDLALVLQWQIGGSMPATAIQLLDGDRIVAEHRLDGLVGAGNRWLRLRYPLRIAPGATANELRAQVVSGTDAAATLELGRIAVEQRARQLAPQPMPNRLDAVFGQDIRLDGWELAQRCSSSERNLALKLQWRAEQVMDVPYTVFVHVLVPAGNIVAQVDSQPRHGQYPTTAWSPGEYVVDDLEVPVPAAARGESLRVNVGWYDARSGQRLTARGEHTTPDYVVLADRLAPCD